MIVQNVEHGGNTHLSFTVPRDAAERAAEAVRSRRARATSRSSRRIAKLSVLGVGMRTHTGVATRMFGALAERGINIALINTSEVRINVATDLDRGRKASTASKRAFAALSRVDPRPTLTADRPSDYGGPANSDRIDAGNHPVKRRASVARDKVVLAYSGGLDTSVAVKWINETYGLDVIAYTCDLGQGQDIQAIREKALAHRRRRGDRRGRAQPVRRLLRLPLADGRAPSTRASTRWPRPWAGR